MNSPRFAAHIFKMAVLGLLLLVAAVSLPPFSPAGAAAKGKLTLA